LIRIGLFYGSTDGHTAAAATQLKTELDGLALPAGAPAVELFDVADDYLEEMLAFDCLVLGVPTWNHGQLQRDWDAVMDEFDGLDLKGKQAAVFGLGDQHGYPDTFADALFFVADKLRSQGATLVGSWPVEGYTFRSSWAVEAGRFLGLVLDDDTEPNLTPPRIAAWAQQIWGEFTSRSSPGAASVVE
jgi:flavodoxin long chain